MKKNGEPNGGGKRKASFFNKTENSLRVESPFPGRKVIKGKIISAAFPFYHFPQLALRIIRLIMTLIKELKTIMDTSSASRTGRTLLSHWISAESLFVDYTKTLCQLLIEEQ
jgi:hypothetical protein